ncbi:hypothetical protein DERF_003833 [Dermatophagoides farinae]|uniref:Uncharacterized protein n=1 Tax=Dermatophagoides farinae TaxID=6954 RepID=A0A922IDD8_DERFA|nr:hypothetical protein DERF_003833 [Dermatophagoides farinae]
MNNVPENIEQNIQFAKIPSNTLRSPLILLESANEPNVSIIRLTHNICTGLNGLSCVHHKFVGRQVIIDDDDDNHQKVKKK